MLAKIALAGDSNPQTCLTTPHPFLTLKRLEKSFKRVSVAYSLALAYSRSFFLLDKRLDRYRASVDLPEPYGPVNV